MNRQNLKEICVEILNVYKQNPYHLEGGLLQEVGNIIKLSRNDYSRIGTHKNQWS